MPSVTVLDPASDTNYEELSRLVKLYEFPAFVKKANLQETAQPGSSAAVTTYADPRNRHFPCHTAAATWLSALYFQEKKAEYHTKDQTRIQQRLERMVDYFHIGNAYQSMLKRAAELNKQADLPDSAYAYVWVDPQTGDKDRHLKMQSAMEVKVAAEWLHKYRDQLPFSDRNTIANKIMQKAARFGAGFGNKLTDFIEKQAGMGIPDPPEVHAMVLQRARLTKSEPHRESILKLAHTIKTKPRTALQPDQLVKLAVTMDMIDRALSLTGRYGDVIKRPEDVIFKVTFTKAASDRQELCALTTGNVYDRNQFEKLSRDDLEALFGQEFVGEVCDGLTVNVEKMAEVAHTLPVPDAQLLDQLMKEAGLEPQMQKAAATGHGLNNQQLEALAAAYEVG